MSLEDRIARLEERVQRLADNQTFGSTGEPPAPPEAKGLLSDCPFCGRKKGDWHKPTCELMNRPPEAKRCERCHHEKHSARKLCSPCENCDDRPCAAPPEAKVVCLLQPDMAGTDEREAADRAMGEAFRRAAFPEPEAKDEERCGYVYQRGLVCGYGRESHVAFYHHAFVPREKAKPVRLCRWRLHVLDEHGGCPCSAPPPERHPDDYQSEIEEVEHLGKYGGECTCYIENDPAFARQAASNCLKHGTPPKPAETRKARAWEVGVGDKISIHTAHGKECCDLSPKCEVLTVREQLPEAKIVSLEDGDYMQISIKEKA